MAKQPRRKQIALDLYRTGEEARRRGIGPLAARVWIDLDELDWFVLEASRTKGKRRKVGPLHIEAIDIRMTSAQPPVACR